MVKKSVLFSSTKSLILFYMMYGSLKSPSYFAGDMRKLKVVSKQTLLGRANPNLGIDFFNSTRHALITSIKGKFAEDQKLNHAKFGIGFVIKVYDHKIDVMFSDEVKSLMHNRV